LKVFFIGPVVNRLAGRFGARIHQVAVPCTLCDLISAGHWASSFLFYSQMSSSDTLAGNLGIQSPRSYQKIPKNIYRKFTITALQKSLNNNLHKTLFNFNEIPSEKIIV
jgi:hypothetical protein